MADAGCAPCTWRLAGDMLKPNFNSSLWFRSAPSGLSRLINYFSDLALISDSPIR